MGQGSVCGCLRFLLFLRSADRRQPSGARGSSSRELCSGRPAAAGAHSRREGSATKSAPLNSFLSQKGAPEGSISNPIAGRDGTRTGRDGMGRDGTRTGRDGRPRREGRMTRTNERIIHQTVFERGGRSMNKAFERGNSSKNKIFKSLPAALLETGQTLGTLWNS